MIRGRLHFVHDILFFVHLLLKELISAELILG